MLLLRACIFHFLLGRSVDERLHYATNHNLLNLVQQIRRQDSKATWKLKESMLYVVWKKRSLFFYFFILSIEEAGSAK